MRVWPTNENARKVLRHPQGNVGFNADGWADWPNDAYTARRIEDGDVSIQEPVAKKPAEKK